MTMALLPGERLVLAGDQTPIAGIVFDLKNTHFKAGENGIQFFQSDLLAERGSKELGLCCQMLLNDWDLQEDPDESEMFFYHGDIMLVSIVDATDYFIDELEREWGLEPADGRFARLFCQCAAILSNPSEIKDKKFVARVFFGDGTPPESDASIFLILDVPSNRAWFAEKSTGYRQGLISWFRGEFS